MAGIQDYRIKPVDAVGDFAGGQQAGVQARTAQDQSDFNANVPSLMSTDPATQQAAQQKAMTLDPERFGKLQATLSTLDDAKLQHAQHIANIEGALTAGIDEKTVTPEQVEQLKAAAISAGVPAAQVSSFTAADIPRVRAMSAMYQQAIKAEQDSRLVGAHIGLFNAQAGQANETANLKRTQAAAGGFRPGSANGQRLPASMQKAEDDDIEAIQGVDTINGQLENVYNQLATGKLDLGMVTNRASDVQNALGWSTDNSRNYDNFRTTMEKMRNDSLRLNKGVQTEGDAQRAWNEIFRSITDGKVVQTQLARVMQLNGIAARQRMQKINIRRQRNNFDPMADGTVDMPTEQPDAAKATASPIPLPPKGQEPIKGQVYSTGRGNRPYLGNGQFGPEAK